MAIKTNAPSKSIFGLLKPYYLIIAGLVILTILANALNLVVPKIVSYAIDSFSAGTFDLNLILAEFFVVSLLIFLLTYGQSIAQIYASERVARDLRGQIAAKISEQDYAYIERATPSKLLTNLTSDVDAVKIFVSQAISSIVSSVFLIIGTSILLVSINWKLGLAVLLIVPIIGVTFAFVLSKVRKLFKAAQETIDWLNRIINESILGSALIRLLNSQIYEYTKFIAASTKSKEIGLSILSLFAMLIPIIIFTSNMATLVILILGGHFVITGDMSLGDFAAFNGYLSILIFPIILIGFMSGVIAQATASYWRILEVLNVPNKGESGKTVHDLKGGIEVENVSLAFGEKTVLKNVSFSVSPWSKTAIMGPTAAGKTQLMYLLTWLLPPTSGLVKYDGEDIWSLDKKSFHSQIGLVFQDSMIFNLTLRENIAFSNTVDDQHLQKAIDTAELRDFIDSLPDKLSTIVSERGSSLSGWQKQRIMLARALALDPKILLLDDFTARLDTNTEKKILENVRRNYPEITLVSVTEKIAAIEDYDQIVLLMEGEALAIGTHPELMATSPEYVQIYNSQQSTNAYELPA